MEELKSKYKIGDEIYYFSPKLERVVRDEVTKVNIIEGEVSYDCWNAERNGENPIPPSCIISIDKGAEYKFYWEVHPGYYTARKDRKVILGRIPKGEEKVVGDTISWKKGDNFYLEKVFYNHNFKQYICLVHQTVEEGTRFLFLPIKKFKKYFKMVGARREDWED